MIYDFLVIGAGSAGVHAAYFLHRGGARVALIEQSAVAAGGSGAAGAFISPRVGRGGELQRFTNEAFTFSIEWYRNFEQFHQTGILRLPKEGEKFTGMERFLEVPFEKREGGFLFPTAGILRAKEYLEVLSAPLEKYFFPATIQKRSDYFQVGSLRTKHVIVATGAWDALIDEPYIRIGKVGGVRFDVRTNLQLPYSMHKKVSVSANIDGIVTIGATHNREGKPPQNPAMLLREARTMVGDFAYEIEQMYCGVRSSVSDHLPIAGDLIADAKVPKIRSFKTLDTKELPRKGIIVLNGFGSRGFVYGPYVGKLLASHLLEGAPLPKLIDVDRYFIRYRKKGRV